MRSGRKGSLVKKMMTWFLLAILLPIMIIAAFTYGIDVKHSFESQKEDNFALLTLAREAIADNADLVENAVRALSYNEDVIELLSKERQTMYDRVIHQHNVVQKSISQTVTILSPLGARIVLGAQDERVPTSWWTVILIKDMEQTADYRRFIDSGKSAMWVGSEMIYPPQMVLNPTNNEQMICYYEKVLTGMGECVGVIKCGVAPEKLFASLKTLEQDNPIHVQMDGQIIYGDAQAAEIAKKMDPNQSSQTIDGQLCLTKKIGTMGMQLVMRLDHGDMLRQAFASGLPLLLALVGSGIFLMISTQVFLCSIHSRIDEAVSFAEHVRSGKMDVRFSDSGSDEMGELIDAFNMLLLQIQELAKARIEHERAEKHALRLALQYQMNPHFLFNTLNWIHMSMEMGEDKKAISESIVILGRLLRYNLNDVAMVPLSEEIENTCEYIRLMNMRKDNLIFLETDLDDSIEDEMVMRFLFQPLCENAIQHGMVSGRPIHIRIAGWQEGNGVVFTVENDGMMIAPERLAQLHADIESGVGGNGVGVVNIAARLRLLYGVNSMLTVSSRAECTCIRLFMEDKEMGMGGDDDAAAGG